MTTKSPNLKKTRPPNSMSQDITLKIWQDIVDEKLVDGDPLSEADFAKRFGVSRVPVRQAFLNLQSFGLIQLRPQRTTTLRLDDLTSKFSMREIDELVRSSIENFDARYISEGIIKMALECRSTARALDEVNAELELQITDFDSRLNKLVGRNDG